MFRIGVVIGLACLLQGCANGPLEDAPLGLSGDAGAAGKIAAAPRSGLGVADVAAAQAVPDGEVAIDSSGKAPAGALDDRDYSGAKLDPEHALKLINDYRIGNGLKPLKLDPRLTIAAKTHSKDLAKTDRISHYGSDGSSPWDRVKRAGYSAKIAAENVGTGQASLDEVFKGWTQSPGHNRNLLLPGAHDMGIALVTEPKSEFKTFWTLVVGASL